MTVGTLKIAVQFKFWVCEYPILMSTRCMNSQIILRAFQINFWEHFIRNKIQVSVIELWAIYEFCILMHILIDSLYLSLLVNFYLSSYDRVRLFEIKDKDFCCRNVTIIMM